MMIVKRTTATKTPMKINRKKAIGLVGPPGGRVVPVSGGTTGEAVWTVVAGGDEIAVEGIGVIDGVGINVGSGVRVVVGVGVATGVGVDVVVGVGLGVGVGVTIWPIRE
jgi:hypothetical protein